MLDDQDDGARIGIWVALGVVAMLLFGLIGGLAIRSTHHKAPVAAMAPVPAERIVLRQPEQTSAEGPAAEARGVEIRLAKRP